jgi:hypothetical protein
MSLLVTLLSLAPVAGGDYKPYVPPAASETSTPLFVIIAYSAIWLILMFFLVSIWMRQRRVDDELRTLRRRLES